MRKPTPTSINLAAYRPCIFLTVLACFSAMQTGQCVSTTFVSVQTGNWMHGTLYEYLTHVLTPYGLRGRLNVTDAYVPWNASAMPLWNASEETKPSTTTTTTRTLKEMPNATEEPTLAPATFNNVQNLSLAAPSSAALLRSSEAIYSTQKPSTTEDGGRTWVRSSVVFNSTPPVS